jgi:hypothetical protein
MDQEVAKTLGELEIKLQELERELTSIGKRDAQPSKLQTQGKLVDEAVEGDGDMAASTRPYAGAGTNVESSPGTAIANAWRQTAAETASDPQHHAGGTGAGLDDAQARAVDNAFGGPAVFGGEEVPAQGATIERDSAFPVSETAYGEIATDSPQPPTASFPSGVFSPATAGTPPPPPGPTPPPPGPPLPPPGPTPPSSPAWPPPPTTPPESPSTPPTPIPQPPPPPQPIDRAELVRFKEKLQRTMEELVDEYSKLLLPKPPA